MIRYPGRCHCTLILLAGLAWLLAPRGVVGGSLPGFAEFRQMDHERRRTGQLQTAELLELTRIDQPALLDVVHQAGNDWRVSFGAAELCLDPLRQRELFAVALDGSRTNQVVLARFAACLASQRQDREARHLLELCRTVEPDNLVPWLVEAWLQRQTDDAVAVQPAATRPTAWRDHGAAAAQARIEVLGRMGYTPYAARRLGFTPEAWASRMAHELARAPVEPEAAPLLRRVGEAMQRAGGYLLTELVGLSLEQAALKVDGSTLSADTRFRTLEINRRRQEIRELLNRASNEAVDLASETEMIHYFDEVLVGGEEQAVRRLLARVRAWPSP